MIHLLEQWAANVITNIGESFQVEQHDGLTVFLCVRDSLWGLDTLAQRGQVRHHYTARRVQICHNQPDQTINTYEQLKRYFYHLFYLIESYHLYIINKLM